MADFEQRDGELRWPGDSEEPEEDDFLEGRTVVGMSSFPADGDEDGDRKIDPLPALAMPSASPAEPGGAWPVSAPSLPPGVRVKRKEGAAAAVQQQNLLGMSFDGDKSTWTAQTVIDGRYRLIESLGRGGMGDVILAEDMFLRRKVAIKTLRNNLADDPEALDSFRQEVAMAHAVSHVGLARTFDLGEAGGVTYLTMEYLEGETLSSRIKRQGPLPVGEVRRIALQVAAAVDAAHTAGVIHRDLKPSNIQLTPDRGAVVMDFGLAAAIDTRTVDGSHGSRSELLRPTTSSAGTPYYMAPEQWRGEHQGVPTDIYAFGAILFEALTGRTPFRAENRLAMMNAHLNEKPPSVRSLNPATPTDLDRLVAACLEKEPNLRPVSMEAVARRLVGRPLRRGLVTAGLALGVLLVIMGASWVIWETTKSLLLREMRPAVQRLAEVAALRIDGAELTKIRTPADIDTEPFRRVWNVIDEIRKENPEVDYIYTTRKLPEERPCEIEEGDGTCGWEYVVDVDPRDHDDNGDGIIQLEEEGTPPGRLVDTSLYPQWEVTYRTKKPQSDKDFITDAWGILLSGYAPIKAPGDEFYVVGVDVGNDPLVRLRNTLFIVFFGLGLVSAGLVIGLRIRRGVPLPGFGGTKTADT